MGARPTEYFRENNFNSHLLLSLVMEKDWNIYPHYPGSEIREGGALPHEHTGYRVGLGCGSFGTYRFRCRTLTVQHRLGKAIQTTANEMGLLRCGNGRFLRLLVPFCGCF